MSEEKSLRQRYFETKLEVERRVERIARRKYHNFHQIAYINESHARVTHWYPDLKDGYINWDEIEAEQC